MKSNLYQLAKKRKNWLWLSKPKSYFHSAHYATLLIIILTLLSACGGQGSNIPNNPYIAPSLAPKIPTPNATEAPSVSSTSAVSCKNDLKYVDDVTVPDGTRFAPHAPIEKIWLVSNAGTCNWENGYTFRLISGPEMGATSEQSLIPARSGSEIEIRILFTAPGAPGNYVSKWQAYNPAGEPFGDVIFIDVSVDVSLVPITSTIEAGSDS
ncbi:MAG: NBR1-Ig-like domain-containing protein [Chloroflexota bacterium]